MAKYRMEKGLTLKQIEPNQIDVFDVDSICFFSNLSNTYSIKKQKRISPKNRKRKGQEKKKVNPLIQ
jgi:hypothetical protein